MKSQSDASQVPVVDNNSSNDAHAEMPTISSVSSVKSKASNISVRSKLGSQTSLKKETNTFSNVSVVVIASEVLFINLDCSTIQIMLFLFSLFFVVLILCLSLKYVKLEKAMLMTKMLQLEYQEVPAGPLVLLSPASGSS